MTLRLNPLAWITGAGGLIGHYLVQLAPRYAPAWRVRGLTRNQFDLTDCKAVTREFEKDKPQLIIHCAALSKSPVCQEKPDLARQLNVDVTAHLAKLAADIPFIFFSTDLVFDGRTGNYDESSPTNPLSVYGETKVAAEKITLANPRHTVIRTGLNGGISPTGDRGFNELLRLDWEAGKRMSLFTDEFRCPIAAPVTARATWELAALNLPGLYHVTGSERLSRWDMGKLMAARWKLDVKLQPGTMKDYKGAPRPADVSLNCAKAQTLLSFRLPGLTEWLAANPNEPF